MCAYSEEIIEAVWQKATPVKGYDQSKYRKDACGAWIKRDKFNQKDSIFGWEIDHIYPKYELRKKGVPNDEIDNPINLRPLNWLNNKSKGQNYPAYISAITAEQNRNKREINYFEIDQQTIDTLTFLYSKYL